MELINITSATIGGEAIQTVNARELHAFLEVGKDFSNWIKARIEAYDFKENSDYVCSPVLASEGRGGHNRVEYHLSLDMAKELAMVERNEKGKQARAYFIECERRAKAAPDMHEKLSDPAFLRSTLLVYTEKVIVLTARVEEMEPVVAAHDRIAKSDGSLCITDAAKTLQVRPKDLFAFLRAHGWVYSRVGSSECIAYQSKLASGLLEHKTTTVSRSDGSEKTVSQVRVTPKGLARLAREFPSVAKVA